MNCAIPAAPFGLTACTSNRLSCQITRAKNSTGRAFSAADCSSARQMSSAVGACADPPRGSPAVEASLSSTSVAGVAPACALADAFAKASTHASSGPVIRVIAGFASLNESETRRAWAWDQCHRQTRYRKVNKGFGVLGIFGGPPFCKIETTPACPAWGEGPLLSPAASHLTQTCRG